MNGVTWLMYLILPIVAAADLLEGQREDQYVTCHLDGAGQQRRVRKARVTGERHDEIPNERDDDEADNADEKARQTPRHDAGKPFGERPHDPDIERPGNLEKGDQQDDPEDDRPRQLGREASHLSLGSASP